MFVGIESIQLLQSIIMDEENNLNLPNRGPHNNDTTINEITEKSSIEQELTNENKRLKTTTTAAVFQENTEPMLGNQNTVIHYVRFTYPFTYF